MSNPQPRAFSARGCSFLTQISDNRRVPQLAQREHIATFANTQYPSARDSSTRLGYCAILIAGVIGTDPTTDAFVGVVAFRVALQTCTAIRVLVGG
jgi:hypothetical protein